MLFEDIKVIPSQLKSFRLYRNWLKMIWNQSLEFEIYLKGKIIERNFSKILS